MEHSKTVRILNLIGDQNGMRFSEIQKVLWEMSNPIGTFTRAQRGYWCCSLLGMGRYNRGLLYEYCVKGKDGLWRRNDRVLPAMPWYGLKYSQR